MLDDDRFEGAPVAHLRYAALLPLAEARRVVEKYANNGTWRRIPDEWWDAGGRLAHCEGSPCPPAEFYPWVIDLVIKSELDHDLTSLLLRTIDQIILTVEVDPTPQLNQLTQWFTTQASPGHAPMAANLLRHWAPLCRHDGLSSPGIPEALLPMAEWLLMHGAAELRATEPVGASSRPQPEESAKHSELLPALVEAMHEHGRRDLLEVSLRYVLLARVPGCGWSPNRPSGLWPQVEAALEEGASESLATDIVLRIGHRIEPSLDSIWAPLIDPAGYPKASDALLRGLGLGLFDARVAREGWKHAFRQPPPRALPPFQAREALLFAVEQLRYFLPRVREQGRERCPEVAQWTERLAEELFRFFGIAGLMRIPVDALHPLQGLLGWHDDATTAVENVLRKTIDAAPTTKERELSLAILAGPIAAHASLELRLRAVLTTLVPSASPPAAPPPSDLATVRDLLTRFVHHPWLARHHGIPIGELLGGRSIIAFEELDQDDKIRLERDRIVIDPEFHARVLSAPTDPERAVALCALYFVHELIHLPQGIGSFATVQDVRSTGAEMTLMHLDLGADHCACLLVAEAFPTWDLLWLKDVTGRSLTEFPAGRFTTQAARYRKAARLVSIRLDYLARSSGVVARCDIGDGYLFADYGPAGGHLLVLSSSLPMGLVGSARLEPKEADVLWSAADPPGRIDEVDAVLKRALRDMGRPA
ncbi:MAG: hypothetical protein AAF799_35160 [Myxococcota bacterium]